MHRRTGVAVWLLFCAAAPAAGEAADHFSVPALEARLRVGEHADVAAAATQRVAAVEAQHGRYHRSLAEPLQLLGDAHLAGGDAEAAIAAFDRAKHIVRIDDGVQGLAQLPLLYREAAALMANGDRRAANDRHELAYSLKLRRYGAADPQLIEGLYQLIDWYRHHHKYRPAQVLYQHLVDLARAHYPPTDPRTIAALAAYADSFREQLFGARRVGLGGFRAWPPGHPEDPPWRTESSYFQGRQLFREVLALTEAAAHAGDVEIAQAAVALGDWHLLHYEYGTAMRHYRRAWRLLDGERALRAALFEQPTPLNLRLPRDPAQVAETRGKAPGGAPRDGLVRLALTITHRGDVVGRRTLAAEPPNIMEFKVRRAAKLTRYRPLLEGGEPTAHGLELVYRYRYYPGYGGD